MENFNDFIGLVTGIAFVHYMYMREVWVQYRNITNSIQIH
jgi:hypothetical protein